MTKLDALNKIRKLPTLKPKYQYVVKPDGAVWIKHQIWARCLYGDFEKFTENKYYWRLNSYTDYFLKPIHEDGELVGFE